MAAFRVLYVDDDQRASESLKRYLEQSVDGETFEVTTVGTAEAAKRTLDRQRVDCIVSANQLPETTGIELLRAVRSTDPHTPVILFTDSGSADTVAAARAAGATDYVRNNCKDGHASDEQFEVLATRITNAIEQERGRIARTQLNETTAVISGLYSVLHETDLSVDEKFDRVLQIGTEELGYPIGYITQLADSSLDVIAAVGNHEVIQEGKTIPLDATFCERTVTDDEPLSVSDAETTDQWRDSKAFEKTGFRCYIGAPIVVDGETYGSLCFASQQPQNETAVDNDELTVKTLAQWVGYEIDRHKHESELKRQIDRLEEFTGVVSHDLRNPLNIAQGRIEIVENECDAESIDAVSRALDRIEAIIEDTLTLARQGQTVDTDEIEPVEIESVAEHCREIVELGDSELRVVDSFSPQADRNRLYQLFENLVRNAVEHSEKPVTIRVGRLNEMFTSTRVESDGTFGFYIEDDGPGVAADKREAVFEPGETTNPEGTGFGLPIVKRIAEAHGWEIHLTESFDGGARFEFSNVR